MKINSPKTSVQLAEKDLLKGTFGCRIDEAHDEHTQYENDMLVNILSLFNRDGEIVGRLVDRVTEKLEGGRKLRNFCEAFGLLDKYNAGELKAQDCVGRTARCEVIIKRSVRWGNRNEIKRYFAANVSDARASGDPS